MAHSKYDTCVAKNRSLSGQGCLMVMTVEGAWDWSYESRSKTNHESIEQLETKYRTLPMSPGARPIRFAELKWTHRWRSESEMKHIRMT